MTTRSSILAWRIPWTEEPVGLQSRGLRDLDMTEWLTLSHFHRKNKPYANDRYTEKVKDAEEGRN